MSSQFSCLKKKLDSLTEDTFYANVSGFTTGKRLLHILWKPSKLPVLPVGNPTVLEKVITCNYDEETCS